MELVHQQYLQGHPYKQIHEGSPEEHSPEEYSAVEDSSEGCHLLSECLSVYLSHCHRCRLRYCVWRTGTGCGSGCGSVIGCVTESGIAVRDDEISVHTCECV